MLEALFNPYSLAIIGASRTPKKVGHEVLKNIIQSKYSGKIYPINPYADEILNIKCYHSISNVPDRIDLGIIAVPASIVPTVVEEAGKKGIKALIIISAGFKEQGSHGLQIEQDIINICKKYQIRALGPNCLGIIDTYTPMNASFASITPNKGNIAFVSQSGALGTAILDWALEKKIGFSKFVSLGNKADIDETDLIMALAKDERTKVILLYLEGIKRGSAFIKAAQKVAKIKPVVILKSGITEVGARAILSHTGVMAGSDLAYNVAFARARVIRADTIEELFDIAEVFSAHPPLIGPNIAIITNAGGPGVVASDACYKYNLKVASIPAKIVEKLREKLPPAAGFFNPIDVLGDASAERYGFALKTIIKSDDINGLLLILSPQAITEPEMTAKVIIEAKRKNPDKPIVTSFLGGKSIEKAVTMLKEAGIPNYEFPERGVRALSALSLYNEYMKKPLLNNLPKLNVNLEKAKEVFDKAKNEGRISIIGAESAEIVNAYGIKTPSIKLAATADEAVLFAEKIGYPVVLKIASSQILHKTDIGGVKININSSEDVRTTFYEIIGRAHIFFPKANIFGVNVVKMVPQGREIIIGVNRDVTFGPLIMFGLGGIYVNFLKDVSFRLAPLTKDEAVKMIEETKAYTLLRGIRGEKRSDIDSVINTILRISKLVCDFEEINEMDINPLFVYEKGKECLALDVKITVKP